MTPNQRRLKPDIKEASWTALALATALGLILLATTAALAMILLTPLTATLAMARKLAQRKAETPEIRSARRAAREKRHRRQRQMYA